MRRQFGKTVVELAEQDPNIVLLYGDVKQNMDEFETKFPGRIFNVGICEQAMISMAAGMALEGLRPIVYSLTPFLLERAFEQWKMDVDVHDVPVIGVGYSFYPTHGPSQTPLNRWEVFAPFKNTAILVPKTSAEADGVIKIAYASKKPAVIILTKDHTV